MADRHIMDQLEKDLTTRFRKYIWSPFLSAVIRYQLAQPGDKIAVCLSGGKDSLLMAKCMQTLHRYSKVPFELVYLSMDPGFEKDDLEVFKKAAQRLQIEPDIFETDIYQVVEGVKNSPCHVCAAMRRGYLYKEAQKRGCNKIALGHHQDDAAETILLSILYGGQFKAMLPKLFSENYEDMQLIRPLYLVREQDIKTWLKSTGIITMTCACRVTKSEDGGKRARVKRLIATLEQESPNVVNNIIASAGMVNLAGILGYKMGEDGQEHSFLEAFEKEQNAKERIDRLF